MERALWYYSEINKRRKADLDTCGLSVVGESIAATPFIKALKEQNPEQPILVTTTTSTGAEQIAKLGDLVEHRYMPIDFAFAVKRFLKTTQPKQMLIIETELW